MRCAAANTNGAAKKSVAKKATATTRPAAAMSVSGADSTSLENALRLTQPLLDLILPCVPYVKLEEYRVEGGGGRHEDVEEENVPHVRKGHVA